MKGTCVKEFVGEEVEKVIEGFECLITGICSNGGEEESVLRFKCEECLCELLILHVFLVWFLAETAQSVFDRLCL